MATRSSSDYSSFPIRRTQARSRRCSRSCWVPMRLGFDGRGSCWALRFAAGPCQQLSKRFSGDGAIARPVQRALPNATMAPNGQTFTDLAVVELQRLLDVVLEGRLVHLAQVLHPDVLCMLPGPSQQAISVL